MFIPFLRMMPNGFWMCWGSGHRSRAAPRSRLGEADINEEEALRAAAVLDGT